MDAMPDDSKIPPREVHGGYAPQGHVPQQTSPPPKPNDAGDSARPPAPAPPKQ